MNLINAIFCESPTMMKRELIMMVLYLSLIINHKRHVPAITTNITSTQPGRTKGKP
jgi:hypothetical protein